MNLQPEHTFRVKISPMAVVMLCGTIPLAIMGGEALSEYATVILAAVLHEGGHLLAARLCGVRVSGLKLDILGARLRLEGLMSYPREWLVAAGGPATNLLCALLAFPAWRASGGEPDGGLFFFTVASLGLGCLNLLPVGTMDGGRMLYCGVASLLGERLATLCLRATTLLCLGALWLLSVYTLLRVGSMLSLFAFSLCLLFRMMSPDSKIGE